MKNNIKNNVFFLLLAILMAACEIGSNMEPVGNWTISEPILNTSNTNIVLDQTKPDETINFEWGAAVTSNRFIVNYRFLLVPAGSSDFSDALMEMIPANSGRALNVSPRASDINYALWAACYPQGESVDLEWVVIAKAIEKEAISRHEITVTPYADEYQPNSLFITGMATETGDNPSNAIPMRQLIKADGTETGIFEIYTSLTSGQNFHFRDRAMVGSRKIGGENGILQACGDEIQIEESGEYKVQVNLAENTFEFTKIERWSLVGDAVEGGWGGDVPLTYRGNSIWEAEIPFFKPYDGAGFIFRANGNWGMLLKRILGSGTSNNLGGSLLLESAARSLDFEIEDLPGPSEGNYKISLNLSASGYRYQIEATETPPPSTDNNAVIGRSNNPNGDAVTGNFDFGSFTIPAQLFLISEGNTVATLNLEGTTFRSDGYVALESDKTYFLNDQADGSGENYNSIGDGSIGVERNQAYEISVDFNSGKLNWKYYNLKIFHWDDANNGWDDRDEIPMTYINPYKFEVTTNLSAGFDIKINSPWDIEFGTDSNQLSGTMVNKGPNFKGITQSGSYLVTITIAEDYSECTYTFVKQ
ncbi:hypothetical protein MM236_15670 [Belliella sp. DSM 107340]|uniref:SusE outer membrane protein domain-containing protein n=1 Tax=Belliella calami TaxID=2923436 RepID=A0ABS9US47_9BACT|nr:hypothetical protein [Belliella calami]MCH7399441.1 hypothetical protein [Belliella calami]